MSTSTIGNADQGKGFEDVSPGEDAASEVGEVAGHGEDQDQFDPLGGLKLHVADADPAPRAEDLVAEDLDGDQREEADAVGPGNIIDQVVVVDLGRR